MTKDDMDKYGNLVRCLGASCQDRAWFETGKFHGETGFLLCSDGFYRWEGQEKFGTILDPTRLHTRGQIERRLEQLGNAALQSGNGDNSTAVYLVAKGRRGWKK